MYTRLIFIVYTISIFSSCSLDPKLPSDYYLFGLTLGMNQYDWQTFYSQELTSNTNKVGIRVFSGNTTRQWSVLGRVAVGHDSAFTWLDLNDDTILDGSLRRVNLTFTDKITDDVYKHLCFIYGPPVSHSFKLGNAVLQGVSNDTDVSFKDTVSHIWKWVTPTMTVEHLYNVFPPDSNSKQSYVQYQIKDYETIREKDRSDALKNISTAYAADLVVWLKLPYEIPPQGLKNWKLSSSVEVLCRKIKNNDLSPNRSIVEIKGNASFYIPLENMRIEFPQLSILPNNPIAYQSTVSFDPVLTLFKAKEISNLRPEYQRVVERMLEDNTKVESRFNITEVRFSDGSILK